MKQQIHFEGIGVVHFYRTRRAKNIVLRVRPFAGVTVSFSPFIPFEKAKEFVLLKREWIVKQQEKISLLEKKNIANE